MKRFYGNRTNPSSQAPPNIYVGLRLTRERCGQHDGQCGKVRRMKKQPPIFCMPKDGKHDRIEKYEVRRALCQQTKPKKNGCRKPNEPRRFLLPPKAQPKDNRQTTKSDIERFDFD